MDILIALTPLILMIILYVLFIVLDKDERMDSETETHVICKIDDEKIEMFNKDGELKVSILAEDGSMFFDGTIDITNGVNFEQNV